MTVALNPVKHQNPSSLLFHGRERKETRPRFIFQSVHVLVPLDGEPAEVRVTEPQCGLIYAASLVEAEARAHGCGFG